MPQERNHATPLSENKNLLKRVDKMSQLTKPDSIHWVDGSAEENQTEFDRLIWPTLAA